MNINIDKPIETMDEDVLGRAKFVTNLVEYITSYKGKDSLTIGLYGKWGSGKTSIINLASKKFDSNKYKIINFNPWNFKGQDELLQCFFKELYIQLDMVNYHKLFTKLGNFFKRVGQVLSFGKYVPEISPFATIIAPLVKDYGETLNNLTYNKSLEKIKDKISNALSDLDKKIVVFIDDVDRLNDNEICQIFQLVKLLGNFENVIYVLSMDKTIVTSALQNTQKEHAETYLEKIIQVPLNVPEISPIKIQKIIGDKLNLMCQGLKEFLPNRNADLQRTGFWQQFNTVRDINRFHNCLNLKFESIKHNVDFHDLCLLTLLEIKYPEVFNYIKNNKSILCENVYALGSDYSEREKNKKIIEAFINSLQDKYSEDDISFVKESLCFMFPKISQSYCTLWGYTSYDYQEEKIRGFISIGENFDDYFQFSETDLIYSKNQISEIIEAYDENSFKTFLCELNKNKQLGSFLTYISYFIECKLNEKRSIQIITWLIDITDTINNESDGYEAFSMDCVSKTAYIIREYLKKSKASAFKLLKAFYLTGSLNPCKVELLRSLQFNKREETTSTTEDSILTIEEIKEIEDLILPDLKLFITNPTNFTNDFYIQYYFLMSSIDDNFCKQLTESIINEKVHLLNYIKNFCTKGQHLTGDCSKTFGYRIRDEFDMESVYNVLKEQFNPNINIDEGYNLELVCFLMCYENSYKKESYTKREIQEYINSKKDA